MDALITKYEEKIAKEKENWETLQKQLEQQFMMEQGAHLGRMQQLQALLDERKKELEEEKPNEPLVGEIVDEQT